MEPINFIYWLNGFLEVANPETITYEQICEIKNHIALVLEKKTINPSTQGLKREGGSILTFPQPNVHWPPMSENPQVVYRTYNGEPPASC